jgi:sulfoxide reductase heme-binding subunit YedZ
MTMTNLLQRSEIKPRLRMAWWQWLVHLASWGPLAVLIYDVLNNRLSANPIQDITFRTGTTALVFLVLSLVCTPLVALLGIKQAQKLRRPLGLYAFLYVVLHFLIFSVLDYALDLDLILGTIAEKRYILVGLTAFVLLIPLALTSTKGWMKRLGKKWKTLHALVYLIAPLAVVHYVWLVKADIRVPLQYGAVVGLLLFVRIPRVRRFLVNLRYRLTALVQTGKTGKGVPSATPTRATPSQAPVERNINDASAR